MTSTILSVMKHIETVKMSVKRYYLSRFDAYFTNCGQLCKGSSTQIRQLCISKGFLKVGILYGLLLALYQDQMSPLLNATLHNGLFLENLPASFNIFTVVFFAFSHALVDLLHRGNPILCHQIIEQLLLHSQSDTFFLSGTVNWGKLTEKSIVMYFQKLAITILAISSSVTYMALFAFEGVITWKVFGEYSMFDSEMAYLYIPASILITVLHITAFSMLMHPFVLTFNLAILVLTAFSIRLWQIEQLVRSNTRNRVEHFKYRFLYEIQQLTVQSLLYLDSVNAIYGKALLLVLLVALPTSAIFIIVSLTYAIEIIFKVSILLAVGFSLFLMFIVHYYFVTLSWKMHKPAKYLLSGKCQEPSSATWRAKLRLATYIEQFHTSNPFTTYGRYGSCTLVTLRTCLFYYVKLLFMSYRFLVIMGKAHSK